jgi:hypothetical protein
MVIYSPSPSRSAEEITVRMPDEYETADADKGPISFCCAEGVHGAHVGRGRDGEADGAGAAAAGRRLRRVIMYMCIFCMTGDIYIYIYDG